MGGRGSSSGSRYANGVLKSAVSKAESMGAKMWEKGGRKRLYLNEAGGKIVGLEFEYYKSGNVASATFNGEPISNRRGIFLSGVTNRAYIDMNTGKLYTGVGLQGSEERAEAVSKLKKFFGI